MSGAIDKKTLAKARVAESPDVESTPTGTRTPVPWLRTKYPRPLDDGGLDRESIINHTATESRLRGGLSFGLVRGLGFSSRREFIRLETLHAPGMIGRPGRGLGDLIGLPNMPSISVNA